MLFSPAGRTAEVKSTFVTPCTPGFCPINTPSTYINEASSDPSWNSTASGEDKVKFPLKKAVSKNVPSLVPVLFGAYMLLEKGRVIVPVPVLVTFELSVGLHQVI